MLTNEHIDIEYRPHTTLKTTVKTKSVSRPFARFTHEIARFCFAKLMKI